MSHRISIDDERIADFRRKWRIAGLSLFGSVLRRDFGPASDVDMLVDFASGAEWSLLDHMAMQEELSKILGRKVDLVSRRAVKKSDNWIRRREILDSAKPLRAGR
jgi:hypothetical protein